MDLNRREMLRWGAMGAAGVVLSSSASSSVLPSGFMSQAAPAPLAPPAPTPSILTPSAPGGINPHLFARAKAALDQHRIAARDWMAVVDFSLPSSDKRFHVVD